MIKPARGLIFGASRYLPKDGTLGIPDLETFKVGGIFARVASPTPLVNLASGASGGVPPQARDGHMRLLAQASVFQSCAVVPLLLIALHIEL